jgi:hypothetical protein
METLARGLAVLFFGLAINGARAVEIDGILDDGEWRDAQHFDAFVSVQPLTGKPAPADRRVEAWLLSTPAGIAVAMHAVHPPGVPQNLQRVQRDARAAVDRFNVMIDFDADGRVAYDFVITAAGDIADGVVSNENISNTDWDSDWQHAVSVSKDGYSAEWLIPWSIAQMRNSGAERRQVGIYFERVIAATGERYAYPAASQTRPRFVSDFARIEVDQYQQSQLAITPYMVAMHDLAGSSSERKFGADVFWKPRGEHQFALALNPDFGQVESDELVVDFSNVETFFTDKRPFFTENQSYFELQHSLGTPFYTRRVGAGVDIRSAVKGNGSFGNFGYGLFHAQEDGPAAREYALLRNTYDAGPFDIGVTMSSVDSPSLLRQADLSAIDARWRPSAQWLLRPLLMHSRVDRAGRVQRGSAAGAIVDWDMEGPWRQRYSANYSGRDFEINDLGYQARTDYRFLEWESGYRQDELPASSRFSSHSWEFELAQTETEDGLLLRRVFATQRYSELRDGGNLLAYVAWRDRAWDDRLSRGNGAVPIRSGGALLIERERPRRGDGRLAWYASFRALPNASRGYTVSAGLQPRWHLGDRFDVDIGLWLWRQSDWLLWQEGDEFGSFSSRRADLSSNLNWFVGERQELRVKLQAIAINAKALEALRLQDGALVGSDATLGDFRLRNLGFQIRYRYKLASLSDIYAVYSRGGIATEPLEGQNDDLVHTLGDTFAIRDNDQILVKLVYRFDL